MSTSREREGVRSRIVGGGRRPKRERKEPSQVEIVVSDGTPEGDLRAAQSEYAAAKAAWERVVERGEALQTPKRVADTDIDRLGLGAVFSWNSLGQRKTDQVELEIARARASREREEAALALADARDKLAAARLAVANDGLPALIVAYEAAAGELRDELAALRDAVGDVLVRTWRVSRARTRERRAAQAVVKAAEAATTVQNVRDEIRENARLGRLPAGIGAAGVTATVERPRRSIFGHDPRKEAFWLRLAEIAQRGPRGASRRSEREAIEKARKRIDDEAR